LNHPLDEYVTRVGQGSSTGRVSANNIEPFLKYEIIEKPFSEVAFNVMAIIDN
jgi:hypothetical protein